jgi:hypothetical protein
LSVTPIPIAVDLRKRIKERLEAAQANGDIASAVVIRLADQEIQVRTDLLSKGFAKREEAQKELDKIRPDHKIRGLDGSVATEGFTDATYKKKEKAVQDLAKIDKALDKAVKEGDYEGLKKLGGDGKGGKPEEASTEDKAE